MYQLTIRKINAYLRLSDRCLRISDSLLSGIDNEYLSKEDRELVLDRAEEYHRRSKLWLNKTEFLLRRVQC